MSNSVQLGHVTCEYVSPKSLRELCASWLEDTTLRHIVTLNPEMIVRAEYDTVFRRALDRAHMRVPDGAGALWARQYLASPHRSLVLSLIPFFFTRTQRITGIDLIGSLADIAKRKGARIYLLGGTRSQLEGAADHLARAYPNLALHTAPPHTFSHDGPQEILEDIRQTSPDILLVAYGAPKQATWIEENKGKMPSVRIAVGVGGAFAMISGELPRAPKIMRKCNTEWLWRLILEPKRMPRIWNAAVKFPLCIKSQKLEQRQ